MAELKRKGTRAEEGKTFPCLGEMEQDQTRPDYRPGEGRRTVSDLQVS
jgi:hypothetical protein